MQAWIGNAAMRSTSDGNIFVLECNSRAEITFKDLVFELRFEE
jgi:hypothetical protein